jgi:putative FmdB family regulatory protein
MPTYEYKCLKCGHVFEVFQKITDKPLGVCPACHKKKVKRLIGAGSGIIFKGSGFYSTDYRKKTKPDTDKKDIPPCPRNKEGCDSCPGKPINP